jgi:hypothetical protein
LVDSQAGFSKGLHYFGLLSTLILALPTIMDLEAQAVMLILKENFDGLDHPHDKKWLKLF